MSQRTIKKAIHDIVQTQVGPEYSGLILERYPRGQITNNNGKNTIIIWCRRGPEQRFAGSGRSLGPIQGVKRIYWQTMIHIVGFGKDVEQDYNEFEDLVDGLLERFRIHNTLPEADDPEHGSQVLNAFENMNIENVETQVRGAFVLFQTVVTTQVEEIYNA